jgi:membrane protein DedA with SNARE-associated domain
MPRKPKSFNNQARAKFSNRHCCCYNFFKFKIALKTDALFSRQTEGFFGMVAAMMDPSWILYLGIFFGPFVQEDAAVIAAATLSAADASHFPVIFFVILTGLFVSDIWKYWIGYAAHTSARARAYADREHVAEFSDKIRRNLFMTLLTARFVPLARVPVYVACGYFKVSYPKFCLIIFFTALPYCLVVFALCHGLGEVFGDRIEFIILSLGIAVATIALSAFLIRRAKHRPPK